MKATAKLYELGQSLWLDNITREMLDSGQLHRYIDEFSITGLTSNPSIFDKAIGSGAYDEDIRSKAGEAADHEMLFFELAIEDLRRAADLFAPGRENLFIKIPGTEQGLSAIEEATFAGIPVNVTLLFSREQYLASANAYLRGIERRIEAGLDPNVSSVASLFISRWDAAVMGRVPEHLRGRLGLAIGLKTYEAYRRLMDSDRWQRLANAGARVQRLLWASTSTKDPDSPDTMYIDGLRAPHTINTMPEATLRAFEHHGRVGAPIAADGGDAEATLAQFESVGMDVDALAATLQSDGARNFVRAWEDLLSRIDDQVAVVMA
jgi:transaldolase